MERVRGVRGLFGASGKPFAPQAGDGLQLLGCDAKGSVLVRLHGGSLRLVAYTPYGFARGVVGLGFNGEWHDPFSQAYVLGNGYRAFKPSLMCFLSFDDKSPFQHGGINGYAYCQGDPTNYLDPSGEGPISWLRNKLRRSDPLPAPSQVGGAVTHLVRDMAGLAGFHQEVRKQSAYLRQFHVDMSRIADSGWHDIVWRESIADASSYVEKVQTSWFVQGSSLVQSAYEAHQVAAIAEDYANYAVSNDELVGRIMAIRGVQRRSALSDEGQTPRAAHRR
ncbi:RHS repeat-associated core domain-containing protein [Pseudomonas sp. GD03858]|uniref:RHS repeat-associated core domain-containing protein n=1 Tax=unclassified Pseudomonas TaxID=196821 RepID=UPI00244B41C6|nr:MULTISPECIES: RHS repeat-associated core domain-containing protein [unclassified Pseudomonas]MDH0648217.1 RHS repeat-associated core domain-containing protein [Pseudomonas sp. GD03867]MDH0664959.1 RHS repeat-associated core domain-containing protein [Pseudomonas sp. GD03858]